MIGSDATLPNFIQFNSIKLNSLHRFKATNKWIRFHSLNQFDDWIGLNATLPFLIQFNFIRWHWWQCAATWSPLKPIPLTNELTKWINSWIRITQNRSRQIALIGAEMQSRETGATTCVCKSPLPPRPYRLFYANQFRQKARVTWPPARWRPITHDPANTTQTTTTATTT